jgi:hypothetical protein
VESEAPEATLQQRALHALCVGWLMMLVIYGGTIFAPLWHSEIAGGAYDIITRALAIEEKLMIALTSSLMTAVTVQRK